MKIFWSWQSDTPGKIGRHFVRDVLAEAIEVLKQPNDIEEPLERETREALHLDHDRKDVPGSPDLARTIFGKIEQAAVFVADVTIVGKQSPVGGKVKHQEAKKFINPNVAIEYGYALHALTDARILLIQNTHFGERGDLPFDLKHKAGPIQFSLAPGAPTAQINEERARLKSVLVTALRPYVGLRTTPTVLFQEQVSTTNKAIFFGPDEVLARVGVKGVDEIEYRFAEVNMFYLRLIPTVAPSAPLKHTQLNNLVEQRGLETLERERYSSIAGRNRFGAISYDPAGYQATTFRAFSQAFTNGELWGVTTELFMRYQGKVVVPTMNVENIYRRVLDNYCSVARSLFKIEPPYEIELGAVGLNGTHLGVNQRMSEPIHKEQLILRRTLNDVSPSTQKELIDEFLDALFDLAGEDR